MVRIGLGYVKGVKKEEMEALVAERERGDPYKGIAELASRSGAGLPSLERLAWAGALDGIPAGSEGDRREALWRVGVTGAGRLAAAGTQLALPMEPPRAAGAGATRGVGRLIADYRSTGMTVAKHPLKLLRPGLDPQAPPQHRSRRDRPRRHGRDRRHGHRPPAARDRQRHHLHPARGRARLGQPHRPAARLRPPSHPRPAAPLLRACGRLERREGTINLVVTTWLRWSRPRLPSRKDPRRRRGSGLSPSYAPSPRPATVSAAAAGDWSRRRISVFGCRFL